MTSPDPPNTYTLTQPGPVFIERGGGNLINFFFSHPFLKETVDSRRSCAGGVDRIFPRFVPAKGQRSVEEYTGINDAVGPKGWRFGPFSGRTEGKRATSGSSMRLFGCFQDKPDFETRLQMNRQVLRHEEWLVFCGFSFGEAATLKQKKTGAFHSTICYLLEVPILWIHLLPHWMYQFMFHLQSSRR